MSHEEDHASRHVGGADPIAVATDSVNGLMASTDKAKLDDDIALDKGVTLVDSDTVVTAGDTGKTFGTIAGGSDNPIVFTLPTIGEAKLDFRFINIHSSPWPIKITAGGSDVFLLPIGSNPASIQADDIYSVIEISSLPGDALWFIKNASGKWKDAGTPANFHLYDGNISGATTGNLASFDALDNVVDSGVAPSDFSEDIFEETVFIPAGDFLDGNVAPAALATLTDSPGKVEYRDFNGSQDEDVMIPWVIPKDISPDGGLKFRVVGFISATTAPVSGEGVVFYLQGYSIGVGEQLGGSYGTAVTSAVADLYAAGVDARYDHWTTALSTVVTVTGIAAGEVAMLNLYRDVSETEDDYVQEIGVTGILITYSRQTVGVSS